MEITKIAKDDNLTIKIVGGIDSRTAPELEAELIPMLENYKNIVLDFSEINYISSAGMRVLLMGHKKAGANGGAFSITNVSSFVMEIFDVTGFSNALNII